MFSDLRQAYRSLIAAKGLAFVAILTLALGIGVTTATYTVIDAVLLRPLPYEAPDRLVYLWEQGKTFENVNAQSSLHDVTEWRRDARTLSHVSAYRYWLFNLAGAPQAEAVLGAHVTADAFATLGARPALGRRFVAGEDRPGAPRVAVLSDALWRRRFGADPHVVGRTFRMDGTTYAVVGVMPAGFDLPSTLPHNALLPSRALELWVASDVDPVKDSPDNIGWWAFGRLAPGATLEQASSELARLAVAQHRRNPAAAETIHVRGLRAHVVRPIRSALLLFATAVGLVLLVACANVAGLLLARGTSRGRELGVRVALGATGARLVRQLLAESLLLAGAGAAGGLALASLGVRWLVALAPNGLPRVAEAGMHRPALAFAALAAVVASVVAGLLPALHAARTAPAGAARSVGRGTTLGGAAQRARGVLVVAEVALSLVLLAGAGLLVRSYVTLAGEPLGFRPERLLTMFTLMPESRFPTDRARGQFLLRAAERIRALPGVEGVAITDAVPLSGLGGYATAWVEGEPQPKPEDLPTLWPHDVSADYHAVLGIPLVAGRAFSDRDTAGARRVVIVSASLARRLLPHGSLVGRRLGGLRAEPLTVVGVVGDVRANAIDEGPQPAAYLPVAQETDIAGSLLVRTRGAPLALERAARAAIASVDPEQPVMNVRTMDDYVAQALSTRRFSLFLTAVFAGSALLLAMVGLYGLLAYLVAQRAREIGVRVALGAQRVDVARLVLGGALRLAGTGALVGAPVALLGARLLRSQLYGVGPSDPITLVAVAATLVGTAALAALVPTRRASRVDPAITLRQE
ncbi:permease [Gemmatirosa kalamazoonensis]|uniref:Permease n=1 Tax=Gemmatirosa kalamazoonensis TaxID=861299 RepID=W0RBJ0_9BACT|nr:ABC transporter permease [Gemmatirosa kalamazoonensis]AHG87817.1 permease [Gemmatirosa kalamazoonensis]